MAIKYHYFPEALIELSKEVLNHPRLQAKLVEQPDNELEIRLGIVAAYCGVVLDGVYTPEDLPKLCDILLEKLKAKNTLIVVP